MSRYRLEITLDEALLARLDAARGREPRASYVKWLLDGELDEVLTPEQQADIDRVVGGATGIEAMTRLQAEHNRRSQKLIEAKHRLSAKDPKPDLGEGTPLPKIAPRRQPR